MQFGTINYENLKTSLKLVQPSNDLEKIILKTFSELSTEDNSLIKEMPLLTVALGSLIVSKMCIMIVSSSGFVTIS